MSSKSISLLVLDGQGVVFNAPLREFLTEISCQLGLVPTQLHQKWDGEIRQLAWSGQLPDDRELWGRLCGPKADGKALSTALEAKYRPGPAFDFLQKWSARVPLWLLSNHRSNWLLPRLERYRISDFFKKILISDALGAMKPSPDAFLPALNFVDDPAQILFVDDQIKNIRAADKLGIRTIFARSDNLWTLDVDEELSQR